MSLRSAYDGFVFMAWYFYAQGPCTNLELTGWRTRMIICFQIRIIFWIDGRI